MCAGVVRLDATVVSRRKASQLVSEWLDIQFRLTEGAKMAALWEWRSAAAQFCQSNPCSGSGTECEQLLGEWWAIQCDFIGDDKYRALDRWRQLVLQQRPGLAI